MSSTDAPAAAPAATDASASAAAPAAAPAGPTKFSERGLLGYKNFVRFNPRSDKFEMHCFDHIEFWCGDATNTSRRFQWGLGMTLVAKSDLSTGNQHFTSFVLQSNDLKFVFTAPLSGAVEKTEEKPLPHPGYDQETARAFFARHGLAVRAVAIKVTNAEEAYAVSTANGAEGVLKPSELVGADGKRMRMSEVKLYGDAVLRYVEYVDHDGPYLPGYATVEDVPLSYGLVRVDHVVGNVWKMMEQVDYMASFTGWHEFAEFSAEDVGTVDSGLNSMVMSNNNEMILLPVNEPTYGTPRKSQILMYLEQNEGPGVQHMALMTDDIFETLTEMRKRSRVGGFEFMPAPEPGYYSRLRDRIGDSLTEEQYAKVEELGILVDKDDQGVLLQIFTKPLGDRPTVFIEIIQRLGCAEVDPVTGKTFQRGGCGGFGKGNFTELFKSIEDYEKTLKV